MSATEIPIKADPGYPSFGLLEREELRRVWINEASEFTPWLARPNNLSILGDTLGLTLELEAREKFVGCFRADLLCKDFPSGNRVLIENQLERTDHGHLGQALTYAAGLDAKTIIWVASRFMDEHRAALDWLNRTSSGAIQFFGVEMQLWRIGNSPVAPWFVVVSKPSGWSHTPTKPALALEEGPLSETRMLQKEFWTGLNKELDRKAGPLRGNRTPIGVSWMRFPVGRSGFHLTATIMRDARQLRAELHLSGLQAKEHFRQLLLQRQAIEADIGCALEWEELPTLQDSRVALYLRDLDTDDRSGWPRQQEWLAKQLNDLHRCFAARVAVMELSV